MSWYGKICKIIYPATYFNEVFIVFLMDSVVSAKVTFLPDKVYSLIWFTGTIHFLIELAFARSALAGSRQNQSISRLVFFVSVTTEGRAKGMDEGKGRRGEEKKKGKRQRCEEVRKTGLKGWKGTPDLIGEWERYRRARSEAADTVIRYAEEGWRYRYVSEERTRLCNVAAREKAGRESGRSKTRDFGTQPWRRRRCGAGSWGGTGEARGERWKTDEERRPSRAEREIASGIVR